MERREEFERDLIGLMQALGISKVRAMLCLAIIRTQNLHNEMASWVASHRGKEDMLTAQAFMSKVGQLSEARDNSMVQIGGYYYHPERYNKES
ncbi:MAG: hypothetical protein IIV29_00245 [Tidjanibacter sp.]|nr:hypothetical protein [Tidjanibacter sp.]